jgi:hypothetical protein
VRLRTVVREDQENRVVETLYGLMEFEGGFLIASSLEGVVEINHEFLRTGEPFAKVRFGLPSAFFGVELSLAGELEFAGVVEVNFRTFSKRDSLSNKGLGAVWD